MCLLSIGDGVLESLWPLGDAVSPAQCSRLVDLQRSGNGMKYWKTALKVRLKNLLYLQFMVNQDSL